MATKTDVIEQLRNRIAELETEVSLSITVDEMNEEIKIATDAVSQHYEKLLSTVAENAVRQYQDDILKAVADPVGEVIRKFSYKGDFETAVVRWNREIPKHGVALFESDQVIASIVRLEDQIDHLNQQLVELQKGTDNMDMQIEDTKSHEYHNLHQVYPHQLNTIAELIDGLHSKIKELEEENYQWKNGGYTSLWKQRTEDRDKTIEEQRLILLDLRSENAHLRDAILQIERKLKESK